MRDKRTEQIRIRLRPAEKRAIQAAAEVAGESMSRYVLDALRARIKRPREGEDMTLADWERNRERT